MLETTRKHEMKQKPRDSQKCSKARERERERERETERRDRERQRTKQANNKVQPSKQNRPVEKKNPPFICECIQSFYCQYQPHLSKQYINIIIHTQITLHFNLRHTFSFILCYEGMGEQVSINAIIIYILTKKLLL